MYCQQCGEQVFSNDIVNHYSVFHQEVLARMVMTDGFMSQLQDLEQRMTRVERGHTHYVDSYATQHGGFTDRGKPS